MKSQIDSPLIRKLLTIKYTLEQSITYFSKYPDEYAISVGICLLHDSIDNLLSAVASYKKIPAKGYMIDKFSKLDENLPSSLTFNPITLEALNTMRNSFKHQAILVNVEHAMDIKKELLNDYQLSVQNIFSANLSDINFSTLIMNRSIKKRVIEIESKLFNGLDKTYQDYKEILILIGKAYYDLHESMQLSGMYRLKLDLQKHITGEKSKRYLFYEPDINEVYRDFLELGITPYSYYRFKSLIPTYGKDRHSSVVVEKMPLNWDKVNWTELNAKFCLNWIIDYFLKRQALYGMKTYQIKYRTVGFHILTPKENVKGIFTNFDPSDKHELSFIKGVKYLGNFSEYREGKWQDYSEPEKVNSTLDIYLSIGTLSGEMHKHVFDIEEINLDELNPHLQVELEKNNEKLLNK